ncbi:MAG: hypothetical protein JNM06_10490 [Blastocatellia bacterium]|nr:hypothetical protein [Blastocatellia bacterium]
MAFFSQKKKVPIRTIAEHFGEQIFRTEMSKENLNTIFGQLLNNETIDTGLTIEWLIFNMFIIVKSVEISIDSKNLTNEFLHIFHSYVYALTCSTFEEAKIFEKLVIKRYESYSAKLSPPYQSNPGDIATSIGILFGENAGTQHISVIYYITQIFFRKLEITTTFLKDLSSKVEFTL